MKKVVASFFFVCLSFSSLAIAETPERIEEFKQKLVAHIESEMTILSQFKVCIQNAQSRSDLKVCNHVKNDAQQQKIIEMKKEQLENQKKQFAIEEKHPNAAATNEKK